VAAVKLSELKEDYVNRRKNLTQNVKKFTATYLSDPEDKSPFTADCKEIIDLFKKEFDGLSTLAKFSEVAFINVYKVVRELPDPVVIATEGLNTCLRVNELLGKAQEQLAIANELINAPASAATKVAPSQQVVKQVELDRLQAQYEADSEELKQSYLNDVVTLRAKYEADMRSKELAMTAVFEKQQLELQHQLDTTVAKKDIEISSLLRSLSDNQLKNQELDERGRLLDAEMTRRRDLEEKWRASVITISDLTSQTQELGASLDKAAKECRALKGDLEQATSNVEKQRQSSNRQTEALNEKVAQLTSQLESRPPVDLSALMNTISSVAGFKSDLRSSSASSISWAQFESQLVDAIRKSDAEATQSRIKSQESAKQAVELQAQCTNLNSQLANQNALVASLEKDLVLAHEAMQASAASKNAKLASKMFKVIGANASEAQLETLINAPRGADESADLEANSSDRRGPQSGEVSPSLPGGIGADSSYNVNDRILLAVQSQRDRYMRSSKDKDGELVELKAKLDRLADEQLELRNENLELYRRLRVLRVGNQSGSANQAGNTTGSAGYGDQKTRSRRLLGSDAGENGDELNLDDKYMSLYEAEISPFRVEELDRQHMMSRLNIFERGLAYINRYILQDRWARHALMVYLALVHIFALIYISQVLNPELIEEVDAHMKAKWSSETLAMQEHPDN
jgi:hypothetical protein